MWDPGKYLDYADLRARPFHELVSRIGITNPRRVADLGCGPGNLTVTLAQRWPGATIDATDDSVDNAQGYGDLFTDAGCMVDAWETTYIQRLTGPDAVLEWISGSALRPVKAALPDDAWTRFRDDLKPLLDQAYPPRTDGTTWFPFRRVFAVAQVP